MYKNTQIPKIYYITLTCSTKMNTINVGQLKVWPSTYSFGFQLTAWTDTAGLTNQLCRIYNNTIRFLAHINTTAASLISSVGFLFNISAWTDTTATSQISPEGFLSIFQLELTQQQPHKSALKDFNNNNNSQNKPWETVIIQLHSCSSRQ